MWNMHVRLLHSLSTSHFKKLTRAGGWRLVHSLGFSSDRGASLEERASKSIKTLLSGNYSLANSFHALSHPAPLKHSGKWLPPISSSLQCKGFFKTAPAGDIEEASKDNIALPSVKPDDGEVEVVGPGSVPGSHVQSLAPYSEVDLPLDAVVKVFTVASSPNYFLPWQNKPQREITGSGFVVAGQRIVTNAHVVADHTFVLVRKHGSPVKYRAEVEAVGHECDLALLSVEDKTFWEGLTPLELGGIPQLQEEVAVVGYPQGGDNISVTGGVVSRVELTQYVHGASHLIAIQIDAAINPGNSGGPALLDDKVAGVAFQNLPNAENIGYIIPVPVIEHFLSDVRERQRYVGFCSLGLTCQALENAQLRCHLKLPHGTTGVLVNRVQPLSSAQKVLQKDDVLLAFDGVPIANDGSVMFRKRERIAFDYLVSMKKAGQAGVLKVLRKGKEKEFEVKLGPLPPLVPIHQFDHLPSYFIFAGLVFAPLTQPYLHEYGEDWYNTSPRRLCERALRENPTKRTQQLVILSQILMDDINAGYERLAELQVKQVNGVEVHNLRHLQHLVTSCRRETIRFDFDDDRVAVLDRQAATEASFDILQRYRIPSAMSEDLKIPATKAEVKSGFQEVSEEDSSKEWWETDLQTDKRSRRSVHHRSV